MGAGAFLPTRFLRNDEVPGQGKDVLLFGKRMDLRNHDIDRIYHEFCKHEDKSTRLLQLSSFLEVMGLERTPFLDIYLMLFEKKKTGFLPFDEFMVAVWNICSSNDEVMATFCFQMFDLDRTNTITIDEVRYMMHAVWSFKPLKKISVILDNLKSNKDGVVTLAEFVLLHRHFPMMLKPLYASRKRLRRWIVFPRFWKELTGRRFETFAHTPVFTILERDNPDFVMAALEYLAARKDTPQPFAEQWRNNVERRRAAKFKFFDVPMELLEFHPPPIKAKRKRNKWKEQRNGEMDVPQIGMDLKPIRRPSNVSVASMSGGSEGTDSARSDHMGAGGVKMTPSSAIGASGLQRNQQQQLIAAFSTNAGSQLATMVNEAGSDRSSRSQHVSPLLPNAEALEASSLPSLADNLKKHSSPFQTVSNSGRSAPEHQDPAQSQELELDDVDDDVSAITMTSLQPNIAMSGKRALYPVEEL